MSVVFPVKRSSKSNQIEMFDQITTKNTQTQGVGARQSNTPTHLEGGRYLDICTKYGFSAKEIQASELSLNFIWKTVAENIGMEKFIWFMRYINEIQNVKESGNEIYFPETTKIENVYRRKFIKHLNQLDKNMQQIQEILKDIGVEISLRTIRRIIDEQ